MHKGKGCSTEEYDGIWGLFVPKLPCGGVHVQCGVKIVLLITANVLEGGTGVCVV